MRTAGVVIESNYMLKWTRMRFEPLNWEPKELWFLLRAVQGVSTFTDWLLSVQWTSQNPSPGQLYKNNRQAVTCSQDSPPVHSSFCVDWDGLLKTDGLCFMQTLVQVTVTHSSNAIFPSSNKCEWHMGIEFVTR